MKLDRMFVRKAIVVLLVLAVFGIYVARLISIQIVQSEEIRKDLEAGSVTTQTIKPARGEIVDRNGVSLVSNELGYNVVIDRAFFPRDTQNEIILKLINLFEDEGESWDDPLPLQKDAPYAFLEGMDTEIAAAKKMFKVQDWAEAEDVVYRMNERYNLEDYSPSDARKIAGVRYAMEKRDFAVGNPYTFATDVSIGLVVKIKEKSYELAGVDIAEDAIRHYDQGLVAPHLIGRVGPIYAEEYDELKEKGYAMDDMVGKSGVELAFEEYLRGENGRQEIRLDAMGKAVQATETKPPILGNTIVLTIDSELQMLAQNALEAQIKWLQQNTEPGKGQEADVGAVVVIHCKTGQILACATYPYFDLNTYSEQYAELAADTENAPLFNRALQGRYAPGSTFKPVVGTTGLATGILDIESGATVFCGHVYTRFTDYQPKCLGSHGNINLTRALSVSCNIFFYDVGWRSGIEAVDKFASQYGLGEPTGIELPEYAGRRSNPEVAKELGFAWNNGDVLQSSIGQLYQEYTPLQLANYVATIANRGTRMKATIVKEIRDYSRTTVVKPFAPVVADRVDATPAQIEAVITGMITASRSGSAAQHFGSYPLNVASKTGTPETATDPNSTFICFAPAEDPEIAIAVVIEKGWHGYTGAPVAKALMDEYFAERLAALGYRNSNPLVRDESAQEADGESSSSTEGASSRAAGDAVADESSEEETSRETGAESAPESQEMVE